MHFVIGGLVCLMKTLHYWTVRLRWLECDLVNRESRNSRSIFTIRYGRNCMHVGIVQSMRGCATLRVGVNGRQIRISDATAPGSTQCWDWDLLPMLGLDLPFMYELDYQLRWSIPTTGAYYLICDEVPRKLIRPWKREVERVWWSSKTEIRFIRPNFTKRWQKPDGLLSWCWLHLYLWTKLPLSIILHVKGPKNARV